MMVSLQNKGKLQVQPESPSISEHIREAINEIHMLSDRDKASDKLFRDLFCNELLQLVSENKVRLSKSHDILDIYKSICNEMTQKDKDNYFLQILDGFRGIANKGREDIREIIVRYLTAKKDANVNTGGV